jgi:hypothetical protein
VLDLPQPQGSPVTAHAVAVGPFSVVAHVIALSAFKLDQGPKPVTPEMLLSASDIHGSQKKKEDMDMADKITPCEHFTPNQG